MGNFRYATEVFAPPDCLWAALIDVQRWPQWTPTVTRAERREEGSLAVGSKTKIWQPKLTPAVWRVTELDEAAGIFTWATSKPGIQVTATHRVERTRHGSQLTLTLDYAGLLGMLTAWQLKDLNWDYLTAEAAGLKHFCER